MERSSSLERAYAKKQTLQACIALCALSIAVGCGDDDAGFTDAGNPDSGTGTDAAADATSEFPLDAGPPPPSCDYPDGEEVGTVTTTVSPNPLPEISGIAASRVNRDILWVANDKHNVIAVSAITTTGIHVATYILSGVDDTHDNEDVAVGPGPEDGVSYLYVGGVGDNSGTQADIRIYRVPEPMIPGFSDADAGVEADGGVGDGGVPSGEVYNGTLDVRDHLVMIYPGGVKRNCEAIMIDPITKDVFLISKDAANGFNRLFRNAFPQSVNNASDPTELEQVGVIRMGAGLDIGVTSADISGDGSLIAARTLRTARIWERSEGQRVMDTIATTVPCDFTVPREPKGEAIGFSVDGSGFYTTSEGTNQPLYFTTME